MNSLRTTMTQFNRICFTTLAVVSALVSQTAHAQKKYDPGASDTEIKSATSCLTVGRRPRTG
jgi:hypothetical protein